VANLRTVPAAATTTAPVEARPDGHVSRPPEHRAPKQLALTIVAPVERRRLTQLKRLLRTMGRDPAGNSTLPLAALPRTHFARLLVLDATQDLEEEPLEPLLIFMADVDEPLRAGEPLERCLEELVDVACDGLDRIFGCCVGYPMGGRAARTRRLAFLRNHVVEPAAAYVNTVYRSRAQILQEDELRRAIRRFIDESGTDWSRRDPREVRAAIRDFVNTQEELAWARTAPPSPGLGDRVRDAADLVATPLAVAALAPLLAPALPVMALLLRRREQRDEPDPRKPSPEHARRLAELEDLTAQNQFSAVGFVKPGLVRRLTTEVVTRGIDYAARHLFNHANLAGVKTIHFARWVWLDDRRRLIFASNYDGSLESYNDDFIDKVSGGLNAVFSNGVGYPRTSWLFFGGAKQEQQFKDYLRRHQLPTQVWYSAYPDLTALDIENNARIRAGLQGEMSREETETWLRLI
jgi:hypothetical protein